MGKLIYGFKYLIFNNFFGYRFAVKPKNQRVYKFAVIFPLQMIPNNFVQQFTGNIDVLGEILGQERTKMNLKSALLTGRHVLIIGPPGVGKTTLAKNVAKLLPEIEANDCDYHCDSKKPLCPQCRIEKKAKKISIKGEQRFIRVQGSPDLAVEDLLGDIDPIKALKYGPRSLEAFSPGKIFLANNGVLFFDELNRCSEKLQNALLQVLSEGTATLGGYTIDLPAQFIFIGTMNPEETTATEKLSDVFLDRFDVIHISYPENAELEKTIVQSKGIKLPVIFDKFLIADMIFFIRTLRERNDIVKKPSVRASIGLYERAQANAILEKRKEVIAKDISDAVISVLSHRIELKPSIKYLKSPEAYIKEEYERFEKEHPDLETSGGRL